MVGSRSATILADDDEKFDTRAIIRLAAWGVCALVSVVLAVFAATTDIGGKRINAALAAITSPPGEFASVATAQLLARTVAAEREARRAAETAIAIGADRERMATRINVLERDLGDVHVSAARALTVAAEGKAAASTMLSSAQLSISSPGFLMQPRSPGSSWTAVAPTPAPVVAAAEPVAAPPQRLSVTASPASIAPPAPAPPPPEPVAVASAPPPPRLAPPPAAPANLAPPTVAATPAPPVPVPAAPKVDEHAALATGAIGATDAPASPKVEFGVDLGPALTVGRLRSRWSKLAVERPDLTKGLRPLVSIRDTGPGKPVEIRLVVGPLANVNLATDFCGALAPQYLCRPAVFDGQRLTVQ